MIPSPKDPLVARSQQPGCPRNRFDKAHLRKPNSLRTQQAIARFGKSARHPLCQAALDLWKLDEELFDAKQRKGVQALIKQFRKEPKAKEATQAYEAIVKVRSIYQELRRMRVARFERECDAVIRTGDVKARRALQRVRKRWIAKEARLKDGDYRTLETLSMLRDKVIKAAWAKDGAAAGYLEAARGGDRALSDEAWEGRLTARDIHSRLMAAEGSRVAGDKDAKEIRRLARKLGIRLAEDQPGRKWKPFRAKQEPKQQPRGRPCTNPWVEFTKNLAGVEAMQVKAGMIPKKRRFVRPPDLLWRPPAEKTPVKVLKQTLSGWRKLKTKKLSA
jgi:hypothetical protein